MQEISEQDALERLRSRVSYGKPATALAGEFGVSQAFMSAVLSGKKRMTDPMLKSIGIERRVTYFDKNPEKRSIPKTKPVSGEG